MKPHVGRVHLSRDDAALLVAQACEKRGRVWGYPPAPVIAPEVIALKDVLDARIANITRSSTSKGGHARHAQRLATQDMATGDPLP